MSTEDSEFYAEMRAEAKKRKAAYDDRVWPIIHGNLKSLSQMGYKVRKITDYQYRIEGILDIYPENKRWHDIKHNERGGYNHMINFVKNKLTQILA